MSRVRFILYFESFHPFKLSSEVRTYLVHILHPICTPRATSLYFYSLYSHVAAADGEGERAAGLNVVPPARRQEEHVAFRQRRLERGGQGLCGEAREARGGARGRRVQVDAAAPMQRVVGRVGVERGSGRRREEEEPLGPARLWGDSQGTWARCARPEPWEAIRPWSGECRQ